MLELLVFIPICIAILCNIYFKTKSVISLITFFFCFSVPSILPFDISTYYNISEKEWMKLFWKISYWSIMLLSWIIIPIKIEYDNIPGMDFYYSVKNKKFTRIKTTLIKFLKRSIFIIIISIIFIIYIGTKYGFTFNNIESILIKLSITYGLILVIFALGYGIVGISRRFYRGISKSHRIKSHNNRLSIMYDEYLECKNKLLLIYNELKKNKDDQSVYILTTIPIAIHSDDFDNLQTNDTDNFDLVNIHDLEDSCIKLDPEQILTTSELDIIALKCRKYLEEYKYYVKHNTKIKYDENICTTVILTIYNSILFLIVVIIGLILVWSEIILSIPSISLVAIADGNIYFSIIILVYMSICVLYAYTKFYQNWYINYLGTCLFLCRFISSLYNNFDYMVDMNTNYNSLFVSFTYYDQFVIYYPISIIIGIICGFFKLHKYVYYFLGLATEENFYQYE